MGQMKKKGTHLTLQSRSRSKVSTPVVMRIVSKRKDIVLSYLCSSVGFRVIFSGMSE